MDLQYFYFFFRRYKCHSKIYCVWDNNNMNLTYLIYDPPFVCELKCVVESLLYSLSTIIWVWNIDTKNAETQKMFYLMVSAWLLGVCRLPKDITSWNPQFRHWYWVWTVQTCILWFELTYSTIYIHIFIVVT